MPRSDELVIQVGDLEDTNQVLAACLNFFQAHDLMEAQKHYTAQVYSPLTNEIARVSQRLRGYMGDYLLNAHEAAEAEDPDEDTSEEPLEAEEAVQEVTEVPEEFSPVPLGTTKMPKQEGRRVPASRKKKLAETQGEEVEHGSG